MVSNSTLSAVELLKLGDDTKTKPVLTEFWPEAVGIPLGIALACFLNFQTKRPALSGIQKHVIYSGGLSLILRFVQDRRSDYLAEKDAVLRHYVELHPEDFPTPPRRKIGDILEPWIPIR